MGLLNRLLGFYTMVMDATKEFFIRILMGVLIFLGYVLLSLFIYAVMRRIMVPQKLHVIPVHLQYSPGCSSGGGSFSCSFPRAEFQLNGGKKLLSSGQYYSIAIELEVPESSINRDMGVFMVNLTFYTTDNQFLATSARPVMVRYKSLLLRTLYTLVFSIPLLLGFWEQEQLIELVLFESYYEPYGDGALSAIVSIQSHNVQIYSSMLTVDANFSGFTYYLYQWPLSMTVIVVISIFITLCTCTVLMWVRDVVRDFEIQRSLSIQRRRAMAHQQQQHQQQQGQQQDGRVGRQVRELIFRQLQRMTGSSSSEESQSSSPPARPARQPPQTLVSNSRNTAAGEHASYARPPPPDDSATPDATPTETGGESSVLPDTDTGSEFSGGFNEMIGSLHSLRRGRDDREEDDDQSTTITETSSVDEREGITGGVSATEGPNIRQRK